jgi:hypothetical protein
MATALKAATVQDAAPPAYQAEVLRGHLCDDLNRRFWRGRSRLASVIEDRKDQIQRDSEKLSPEAFLAKYESWRFL